MASFLFQNSIEMPLSSDPAVSGAERAAPQSW
jgi:hypothetical protein